MTRKKRVRDVHPITTFNIGLKDAKIVIEIIKSKSIYSGLSSLSKIIGTRKQVKGPKKNLMLHLQWETLTPWKKFEELLTSGQAILVDEAGNPLKKVEFSGDCDSEDEVASVDNDMTRSMASERVGFGAQSLLEQWRDSYGNGDYDDDP
ncbi:hypothetical protein Tco_0458468 [Tanacetum coccineum]